ncbi:hypothetical protein [Photobacterium sanctipauli]|uniref:hypothetical protein n=1 Tax=Photobacterium sanctipauli TaxID=1342794 RepID=UPI00056C5343|nr:hypothetical protein [Photobacterium sanctipauli]
MNTLRYATIAIGTLGLIGCQLTQSQYTNHSFNDPVNVHDYQLPVYPDGIEVIANYRQNRNQETWYWSELENKTFQRGENMIVQVIGKAPLKQPPPLFAFTVPVEKGEHQYNAVGPYQRWVKVMPNGDACLYAQQHTRKDKHWLSVFVHYCTPDNKPSTMAWLNQLKPSFYLEDF